MELYNFLANKINVGGYIMPIYRSNDIMAIQKKLEKKKITVNYETLDLLFYCFSDLNQFLRIIKYLYLPEEVENDHYYNQTYYDIFFAIHYFYKEEILIDKDLKEVLNVFCQNNIDYFEDQTNKMIFWVLFRYYWINKDKITIEDFNKLVNNIKNNNYKDLFIMNGVIYENGRPKTTKDNYYSFIDYLLKEKNKMIIK